jgi:hypothetical protein
MDELTICQFLRPVFLLPRPCHILSYSIFSLFDEEAGSKRLLNPLICLEYTMEEIHKVLYVSIFATVTIFQASWLQRQMHDFYFPNPRNPSPL